MPLRLPHAAPSPYLLETVSIRKARPTLNAPIGCIERIVQDGLIIGVTEMSPQTLAIVAPTRVKKKSLENFEAFTLALFCTKDRERRSYSPSTAFLAAAAIWSRSSLVG